MFIVDIRKLPDNQKVSLTGIVIGPREYSDYISARIQDISGTIVAIDITKDKKKWKKGNRLRLIGTLKTNETQQRIIEILDEIILLGNVSDKWTELDSEMREQASRMLLSRVIGICSQSLREANFIEFESRVISSEWNQRGLEPLYVLYPGFGSPATLATSPATQVTEFLSTTGATRAFTNSISFSSTYRSQYGGSEVHVTVAKALDLPIEEQKELVWKVSQGILQDIGVNAILNKKPGNEGELKLVEYQIPTGLTDKIDVIHLEGNSDSIFIESWREKLGESSVISGITFYPAQFLSLIQKTPTRQLKNLGIFNVWH